MGKKGKGKERNNRRLNGMDTGVGLTVVVVGMGQGKVM